MLFIEILSRKQYFSFSKKKKKVFLTFKKKKMKKKREKKSLLFLKSKIERNLTVTKLASQW